MNTQKVIEAVREAVTLLEEENKISLELDPAFNMGIDSFLDNYHSYTAEMDLSKVDPYDLNELLYNALKLIKNACDLSEIEYGSCDYDMEQFLQRSDIAIFFEEFTYKEECSSSITCRGCGMDLSSESDYYQLEEYCRDCI